MKNLLFIPGYLFTGFAVLKLLCIYYKCINEDLLDDEYGAVLMVIFAFSFISSGYMFFSYGVKEIMFVNC